MYRTWSEIDGIAVLQNPVQPATFIKTLVFILTPFVDLLLRRMAEPGKLDLAFLTTCPKCHTQTDPSVGESTHGLLRGERLSVTVPSHDLRYDGVYESLLAEHFL